MIQPVGAGIIVTFDTNGNNVTLGSPLGFAGGIAKVGTGTPDPFWSQHLWRRHNVVGGATRHQQPRRASTGTFTINGGSIDNTSGSAITLSTNNTQTWSGSFTFVGSNPLNLGTGAVTLTSSPAITVTSGTLTVGASAIRKQLRDIARRAGTLWSTGEHFRRRRYRRLRNPAGK